MKTLENLRSPRASWTMSSHKDRKIEDRKMGLPSIFLSSIFLSLCGDTREPRCGASLLRKTPPSTSGEAQFETQGA
jgi:hypothetical protein